MSASTIIEDALARHGSAVLSFSGGKDSIAVLHHCRPWHERITVLFVDMGAGFPHVRPFVERLCHLWDFKLQVVKTEPPRHALPSDLVPTWSTPFADWFLPEESKPQTQLISGIECCNVTLWQPLAQAIRDSGTTLVLRGSKGTDEHISVSSGTVHEGIEYVNPLWDWSDSQVFQYLDSMAVPLPLQYQHGCNTSLDCATCTAWLNTEAELQRVEFTRQHYPEAFTELQRRMTRVVAEIERRSEELVPAIASILASDRM